MDETPYSKRELDTMFSNLEKTVVEKNEDVMTVLNRIEAQTTKTNGRVNALEAKEHERRGSSKWVMGVGAFLASVLVGYLSWVGAVAMSNRVTVSNLQLQITQLQAQLPVLMQNAVSQALIPYAK